MTILFLTDEQAEKLEITGAPYLKLKEYPLCPGSVVVDNEICRERRFVRILGRTALRILREGK